ncbi:hypothetical protein B0H13DRAFT_2676546 [Mycena leptocephala]|nr:hypothetical protein B0H13DRAFT_2676546 [Mycena leptocephala]
MPGVCFWGPDTPMGHITPPITFAARLGFKTKLSRACCHNSGHWSILRFLSLLSSLDVGLSYFHLFPHSQLRMQALIHRADPLYRRKGTPSCWDVGTCQDHATNQVSAGAVPVVMLTRVQVVLRPESDGRRCGCLQAAAAALVVRGIGSAPPIYGSFPPALRLRWKDNGRVAFLNVHGGCSDVDVYCVHYPSAQRPCTPPEAATPPAEEEKVQRNANYAASSSTATTTTTTCLLMENANADGVGETVQRLCAAAAGSSNPPSPAGARPSTSPSLDLRRAWSMPRSARVGAAIAYPALGRHMSRTRGDGGRRANNGGFAALRPRLALRTSSHTQRLQPLAQAQFKITAQRLEG